ncbi:MAG: hypothetical protein ABL936_22595 [Aestuariivirga sp.]
MKIAILTGSELRHSFVRKYLALSPGIGVVLSTCEGAEKSLQVKVKMQANPDDARLEHLEERRQSEDDLFGAFIRRAPDRSNPVAIAKGALRLCSMAVTAAARICWCNFYAYGKWY